MNVEQCAEVDEAFEKLKISSEGNMNMDILPLGNSAFLGIIEELPEKLFERYASHPKLIIILDTSIQIAKRLKRLVLPEVLKRLSFSESEEDAIVYLHEVKQLDKILLGHKIAQILFVSDAEGSVWESSMSSISENLNEKLEIIVHTVRIVLEDSQTKDLSPIVQGSVLQIHEGSSESDQIDHLANLLRVDISKKTMNLSCDFFSNICRFHETAVFWVRVDNIKDLLDSEFKIETGKGQVKVNVKIISTIEKSEAISHFLNNYFDELEGELGNITKLAGDLDSEKQAMFEVVISNLKRLEERVILIERGYPLFEVKYKNFYFRFHKIKRSIIAGIQKLNNDAKLSDLEYMHNHSYNIDEAIPRRGRELMKRAAKTKKIDPYSEGDVFYQEEIHAINDIWDDFRKSIDQKDHKRSLITQQTTLDGLDDVVKMLRECEQTYFYMAFQEVPRMINIVGIACEGPIDYYPDASLWRVDKIYPGVFLSVSDILKTRWSVKPVIEGEYISNVIPIFDDERVAEFFKKHCPKMLSYTCSLGMRRLDVDIPMTSGYTICAGIWKMIEMIAKEPSDLNLNTLKEMCSSLEMVAGDYFKNAQELLCRSPSQDGKYFYLGDNGYKNFILPIYKLFKSSEYQLTESNIPAILRALFSYEIWRFFQRKFKGPDAKDKISEIISNLVVENEFNYEYLDELMKDSYLKYIFILFLVLKHIATGEFELLKSLGNLESLVDDENFIKKQLVLYYDYKEYLMYSALQSLLFPKAKDRYDFEKQCCLIDDLIEPTTTKEMIFNYQKQ